MVWLVDAGTYVRGLVRSPDKRHWGLDVRGDRGTHVRAVLDGTFLWRRRIPTLGLTVAIQHGDKLSTLYAHLDKAPKREEGAPIKAGDVDGRMGNSFAGFRNGVWVVPKAKIGVHLH